MLTGQLVWEETDLISGLKRLATMLYYAICSRNAKAVTPGHSVV